MNSPDLIRNENSADSLFAATMDSLVQGIGGLASLSRREAAISISHLVQRSRGIGFLTALKLGWDELKLKAKIPDGYNTSDQCINNLQELLQALDSELVDETRFDAMKRVFLVSASEERSSREGILPYQLMQIARSLSSGELLVLKAAFQGYNDGLVTDKTDSAHNWLARVSTLSNLKYSSLVEVNEEKLILKHLLSGRLFGDKSGVQLKPYYRLTELGKDFCEFISHYDELVSA